jgi:uncharacterized protein YgbK (DUF1537 family)
MLLGAIADDFTGGSDLVNTLSRGGFATLQAVGVPQAPLPADCDAVVVALKIRSCDPREAVAQSLAALAWLKRAGARQFVFKVCSTFDSTPHGNIGPVAEALRLALGTFDLPPPRAGEGRGGGICVPVCPAYPSYRRTIYRGHLFVGDALLSESGMQHHPLTPMTDANLVRVLQAQTRERVGLVPLEDVRAGSEALAARLRQLGRDGCGFAIVDCAADDDLRTLALAAADAPLVVGGSGIALGLPENYFRSGASPTVRQAPARPGGPLVVLAGSCSQATRGQVAQYAATHPLLAVDAARALREPGYVDEVADWCLAQSTPPLVTSTAAPQTVAANTERLGRDVAAGIEHFFARLAQALAARGVRRFVVAGGETSGAVVEALELRWLTFGAEIDPGAPSMFGSSARGDFALALKSGNFGAADFFVKAQSYL